MTDLKADRGQADCAGELTDAQLDRVTGGDGKTTAPATTKGTKPTEYIVVTQESTLISGS